ncbi:MAG: hypothetical protein WC905_02970 [Patescibacteria group bacterium]|jgi:hypothetical protein
MKKNILLLVMIGFMCGCVSQQGRLSVVDIDFRKAAQIDAGAREAEAPYKDWSSTTQYPSLQNETKAESRLSSWYAIVFDALTKLECRLTLVQIEWADHRKILDNK